MLAKVVIAATGPSGALRPISSISRLGDLTQRLARQGGCRQGAGIASGFEMVSNATSFAAGGSACKPRILPKFPLGPLRVGCPTLQLRIPDQGQPTDWLRRLF
jgi:hypothetical protein